MLLRLLNTTKEYSKLAWAEDYVSDAQQQNDTKMSLLAAASVTAARVACQLAFLMCLAWRYVLPIGLCTYSSLWVRTLLCCGWRAVSCEQHWFICSKGSLTMALIWYFCGRTDVHVHSYILMSLVWTWRNQKKKKKSFFKFFQDSVLHHCWLAVHTCLNVDIWPCWKPNSGQYLSTLIMLPRGIV